MKILSVTMLNICIHMFFIVILFFRYIILCGYPPFEMDESEEALSDILAGRFIFHPHWWGGVSEIAKDLVSNLLKVNPKERFNGKRILSHPWFTSST